MLLLSIGACVYLCRQRLWLVRTLDTRKHFFLEYISILNEIGATCELGKLLMRKETSRVQLREKLTEHITCNSKQDRGGELSKATIMSTRREDAYDRYSM